MRRLSSATSMRLQRELIAFNNKSMNWSLISRPYVQRSWQFPLANCVIFLLAKLRLPRHATIVQVLRDFTQYCSFYVDGRYHKVLRAIENSFVHSEKIHCALPLDKRMMLLSFGTLTPIEFTSCILHHSSNPLLHDRTSGSRNILMLISSLERITSTKCVRKSI